MKVIGCVKGQELYSESENDSRKVTSIGFGLRNYREGRCWENRQGGRCRGHSRPHGAREGESWIAWGRVNFTLNETQTDRNPPRNKKLHVCHESTILNEFYHLNNATKSKPSVVNIHLTCQMGSVETPLHLMGIYKTGCDSVSYL